MNTITVKDFAKEKGMLSITIYKQIERCGVYPVGTMQGVKKPFNLYNKNTLEKMVNGEISLKQNNFNVSKLW